MCITCWVCRQVKTLHEQEEALTRYARHHSHTAVVINVNNCWILVLNGIGPTDWDWYGSPEVVWEPGQQVVTYFLDTITYPCLPLRSFNTEPSTFTKHDVQPNPLVTFVSAKVMAYCCETLNHSFPMLVARLANLGKASISVAIDEVVVSFLFTVSWKALIYFVPHQVSPDRLVVFMQRRHQRDNFPSYQKAQRSPCCCRREMFTTSLRRFDLSSSPSNITEPFRVAVTRFPIR